MEDLKPIAPVEEQSATVSEPVVEPAAVETPADNVKEETVEVENEKVEEIKEKVQDIVENVADKVSDVASDVKDKVSDVVEDMSDFAGKSLKEIVDIFQNLVDGEDVQKLYKHAESLKAAFYKTLKKEKIAMGFQAPAEDQPEGEAPEASAPEETAPEEENVSANPFATVERGFKDLYAKYRGMRASYAAEQEKQREENYTEKMALIDQLKDLVEKQEDLNQTFPAFREIQNKWRAVGPVPQNKMKDLYETYQHYVEKFYDYVKINKELRDLDFKKNLEAKQNLCEKAEALAEEENVVGAFRTLQKLHEEWKELGPVNKENREEIWNRFKAATAVINKKHQAYFESQKGNQKENFEAKTKLCERVEEIAKTEVKDSSEWNTLSKEIENIQKEWKTIGFASKKDNQKVYERFRAACDEFFTRKREFYSDFKSQMQENMEKKIALCEQAEALKDSEDWKKTSELFVELQKQWKEIGPVSRKKSEQIWKRFRAACDSFFDNRDKHYGSQDSQYAENLAAKQALIEEVNNFELTDDREANFEALKAFQTRWNEIGFVPFKDKAKVQDAFKKALDARFDDLRNSGEGRSRFGRHFANASDKADRAIRTEREKLVAKFVKKEQEIATWQNNMGFFSKSKNADALLEELNKKIEIAKEELAQLEEKVKEFDKQFEEKDEQ